MRIEPTLRNIDVAKQKKTEAERVNAITRKVAIGFVLIIIIFFFLKMLLP